jgi:hypothetical protein
MVNPLGYAAEWRRHFAQVAWSFPQWNWHVLDPCIGRRRPIGVVHNACGRAGSSSANF